MKKADDDQYSDKDAERRMNEALRRALTTPPKPQATVRHPRKKGKFQLARIVPIGSRRPPMRAVQTRNSSPPRPAC